jgi:hypothetical protein
MIKTILKDNGYQPPDLYPVLLAQKFNTAIKNTNTSFNIGNSSLQTGNKNNNTLTNAPLNLPTQPKIIQAPVKTASSNMLVPTVFRAPYKLGERIGQHQGNVAILKSDKTVLINGRAYNLPQSAIDQNKKGNGIGILRSVNYWIAHPEAIATAYNGVIPAKKPKNSKVAASNPVDKVKSFMVGAIRAGTIGLALKGEANIPGYGRCKYTMSFLVNNKDIEAFKNGTLNFGDIIQKGGFSLTLNKVLSSVKIGGLPAEKADTNSISFNQISGFTKTFGQKETLKTGEVSLELGLGGRIGLDGKIGIGASPKLSLKIPGSQALINKGLQSAIDWAGKSALVNTVISPPLAALQVTLAGALAAIQSTKPYLAIEAALPVAASLDVKTGQIALSTQKGNKISGTLPQLTNSMLDVVGLGKYQLAGGKAHVY